MLCYSKNKKHFIAHIKNELIRDNIISKKYTIQIVNNLNCCEKGFILKKRLYPPYNQQNCIVKYGAFREISIVR